MKETIDLVFATDTTGSIYPALTQIRNNIASTSKYLFGQVPNIRIGLITHGDYCDKTRSGGMLQKFDLSGDPDAIERYIKTVNPTGGCSRGAVYEQVLKEARGFSWTSGKNKALVMIGDTYPHTGGARNRQGTCECGAYSSVVHEHVEWRNELDLLTEAGIKVYPVRALESYNRESTWFWQGVAERAGSPLLKLEQFEDVSNLVLALSMNQAAKLPEFERHLRAKGNVSQGIEQILAGLTGKTFKRKRSAAAANFRPVASDRFQILGVPYDTSIKDFVVENGLTFKVGRGFYEFTKPVLIQDYKEVIVQDRETGDMFTGNDAREILGIPVGRTEKVRPSALTKWRGFVQSTSANRKLLGGTKFLYEAGQL